MCLCDAKETKFLLPRGDNDILMLPLFLLVGLGSQRYWTLSPTLPEPGRSTTVLGV